MTFIRRYLAARKLQKLVEQSRRSPATQEYARRRAAMLGHTRQRSASA